VGEVFANLGDGLRYVRRTGLIMLAIAIVGVVATAGINFTILIPPLAADILHVGASGYGFLMAASGLGSLLAALAIAFGGTRASRMLIGALVLGIAEILIGGISNYAVDLVLMFIAGAGAISMMATANTVIQLEVPDELRGRVMSVYLTVFAGTNPIGGVAFGAIAANAGAAAAIGLGGAISVAAALVGVVWYRRLPHVDGNLKAPGRPPGPLTAVDVLDQAGPGMGEPVGAAD
ncbi:MAG: MFS transporter, partial [Candidatus Limnocylindrales bacterium]